MVGWWAGGLAGWAAACRAMQQQDDAELVQLLQARTAGMMAGFLFGLPAIEPAGQPFQIADQPACELANKWYTLLHIAK